MSSIIITINTDNAAFAEPDSGDRTPSSIGYELARILRYMADEFAETFDETLCHANSPVDSNGNTVGTVEVKGDG